MILRRIEKGITKNPFRPAAWWRRSLALGTPVAMVIVLIGITVWLATQPGKPHDCRIGCATDFSASRK